MPSCGQQARSARFAESNAHSSMYARQLPPRGSTAAHHLWGVSWNVVTSRHMTSSSSSASEDRDIANAVSDRLRRDGISAWRVVDNPESGSWHLNQLRDNSLKHRGRSSDSTAACHSDRRINCTTLQIEISREVRFNSLSTGGSPSLR